VRFAAFDEPALKGLKRQVPAEGGRQVGGVEQA
jgi:hypothetical protein